MNIASSSIFSALLLLSPAMAATVTISTTAPTIDGADIANLSGGSDAGGSGNNGHMWSNRPHQGQSFITGSNTGGYQLNAVTLQNLSNNVSSNPTFNVLVGSFAGTTLTQIGSTETGAAPNYTPGDYITFTFDTPLTLAANTTYAFIWGSNGEGFVTSNNLDDSTYTGGTALSSGDNNVPVLNNVISRNLDRVFHVDLVAIPEPGTALLGLLGGCILLRRRR